MDWSSILSNTSTALVQWEILGLMLAAIGLNLHFGYTGLLNFGQAGFMGVGAYGMAISIKTFGLGMWEALGVTMLLVIVLAFVMGVPAMRGLRTDYFAIVTIAVAEIIRIIVRAASLDDWTGGSDGLGGFVTQFRRLNPYEQARYDLQDACFWSEDACEFASGWFRISKEMAWVATVGWTIVVIALLMTWLLMRSPWGRVLKGIREDEDAVRALGKNVSAYKMQSLILGGFFGATGGMVFAFGQASAQSDNFSAQTTFFVYTVLILGGAARVLSPVAGAMIFWLSLVFLEQALSQAVRAGYIPPEILDSTQTSLVRFILLGLVLMLLMIFRPQGMFGNKRELQLDAR